MQLTFEQLPDAVTRMFLKLESIEQLLMQRNKSMPTESEDLFNIKQAAEFIGLKLPTIYSLVSRSEIPSMKKGNRLYFSKRELTDWIRTGKKKTIEETVIEVDNYLSSKQKRRA